jgi:hypothetical protein
MLFQIALILFALTAIYKTWRQYQFRQVSRHWLLVFGGFWLFVALVALTPQSTDIFANYVGVGRGADLLVYIAIVVLFYVVYRLLVRQQKMTEEITELVRRLALTSAQPPQIAEPVTASQPKEDSPANI